MEDSKFRFRVTRAERTQRIQLISGMALILLSSLPAVFGLSPAAFIPLRLVGAGLALSSFDTVSVNDGYILSTRFSLFKTTTPVSEIGEIRMRKRKETEKEGILYTVYDRNGSRCFSFADGWENSGKLLQTLYNEGIRLKTEE